MLIFAKANKHPNKGAIDDNGRPMTTVWGSQAGGGHSDILVYTCMNKKTCEKGSFFLATEQVNQGMSLGV